MAEQIVGSMDKHSIYVEPYCGSAAVLLAKPPSKHEVINDADGRVVAFYRALRDHEAELVRRLSLTPYSHEEYLAAAEPADPEDVVEVARRFVVRASQSVNAAGPGGSAGWALSTSRNQSRPGTFAGAVDRLPEIAARLRRVAVMHADGLDVVARWAGNPSATIYVDPPYLASTRRALGPSTYLHDTAGPDHHAKLLSAVVDAKAQVLLSGYGSDLYRDRLDGWAEIELPTTKPSANRAGGSATRAAEVLWVNRRGAEEVLPECVTSQSA